MLHWAILGELCAKDSALCMISTLTYPDLSQVLKLILRAQNWYILMRLDEISMMVVDLLLYLNQIRGYSQKNLFCRHNRYR